MPTQQSLILTALLAIASGVQAQTPPEDATPASEMAEAVAIAEAAGLVAAENQPPPFARTEAREPCRDYTAERRPHFGDFHVHTAWSFDANSQDTRNKPADAYRFARGEPIGIQPYDEDGNATRTIKLDRPLDFTAVTDHSEFMGEMRMCTIEGSPGYWHPACIAHRYIPQLSFFTFAARGMAYKSRWGFCGDNNETCFAEAADTWQDIQRDTENAYDRSSDCRFTSFVGYEWTASAETGQNLHHNVIFRNAQVPDRALSWIETPSQVQLWDYLDEECVAGKPGCDAVVIPHNSNISGGLMFATARITNKDIPADPVTAEEATRRARWNTLFEVMQHKGASECDSRLPVWSEDEYCNFELMGYDRFGGKNTGQVRFAAFDWLSPLLGEDMVPVTTPPAETNFLRYALKKGLKQQQELGVNSFKFGLISSTDTHIAAPGLTMEKNHPGHGGAGMGAREGVPVGLPDELEYGPGGLAVLYAEENSRDALFAAMQRREAYATSGTRPVVRFFGGWDYPDNLCSADDMVAQGYAGGVPMGGDLPPATATGRAPRFLVSAGMDNGTAEYPGSPLQRIQLIKGWYAGGELHEQVLDVAGGDNNASVDIHTCEPSGIGHPQLCSVWEDSDFDPAVPAFYYTRVLENPTCRWSQRICADAGIRCDDPQSIPEGMENCCSVDHQKVIQERAWSSPIWYTPPA
ncbi:MAG: DUF3604 domain-containing protein [Halioglobus sp.]|nr:DUF3604 domain-containing protein [Halioglobus sp.]